MIAGRSPDPPQTMKNLVIAAGRTTARPVS